MIVFFSGKWHRSSVSTAMPIKPYVYINSTVVESYDLKTSFSEKHVCRFNFVRFTSNSNHLFDPAPQRSNWISCTLPHIALFNKHPRSYDFVSVTLLIIFTLDTDPSKEKAYFHRNCAKTPHLEFFILLRFFYHLVDT